MIYGLELSASGLLATLYRQDVLTSNLANLNTVAFKPDIPAVRQRDAVRAEDGLWHWPSDAMLERLGGGVMMMPNRVSFAQGPIQSTGNPLDLAIEGDGFFMVRAATGAPDAVALTRDGRLSRNDRGQLVMVATGAPLLDVQRQPIVVDGDSPIQVLADGQLRQAGRPVARLALVDVVDRQLLRRLGEGLFELPSQASASARPATGRIVQGAVEGSAVNEIDALMQVTSAARDVGAHAGMLRYYDRTLDRAINTFGRIS